MKKILFCLALAVGAFANAATLSPVQLLNPAGSTAGQAIVSTGPSTAPGWATVVAGSLTPVAGNAVIGNFTASSASPVANTMPSCSTANSAMQYTLGVGLSCGTVFALTSGNLSQFAATTSAQLAGVISNETGSGALVFGTSPTLSTPSITGGTLNNAVIGGVTPAAGIFTTITATGALTPSQTSGIVGTTTNNNANAGSIGEYVSSTLPAGSAISLTSNTAANVTSISLTAGDWDVWGTVAFNVGAGTAVTLSGGGINTTSAVMPTFPANGAAFYAPFATNINIPVIFPTGTTRMSLSATTTVYLVAVASFSGGTDAAYGFIGARRVR